MDLEKFFDISLCIVRLSADNRSLTTLKISQRGYMHISRKPKTWDNLVIIAERGDDLYYVRKPLSELLSKFSPGDAVLPMSPRTLFGIYGCDISEITEESLARLEIDMGKKFEFIHLAKIIESNDLLIKFTVLFWILETILLISLLITELSYLLLKQNFRLWLTRILFINASNVDFVK